MDTIVLLTLSIFLMVVPLAAVLIVAYFSIRAQQSRAAEEEARAAEELLMATEPRFFVRPGAAKPKERIGRAVVVQIEDYLARERAAVDHFVTSPSVETLCRGSETFAMRNAARK
jgi:hypothetical protein